MTMTNGRTAMTNAQPDIFVPLLPEICKACGDALLIQIKRETSWYQISRFCEHTNSLIYASLGVHEGTRAVTLWTIQGPISEQEAKAQIAELAERDGADLEILHDSERLH